MGIKVTIPYTTIKGNAIAMVYEGAEAEFDYEIDGNRYNTGYAILFVKNNFLRASSCIFVHLRG
jgi:hypothetical protein